MAHALVSDLAYPSLDGITRDLVSARIIAPAYAASNGSELTAVLQYIYHHFNFNACNLAEYAEALEDIAIAEMRHIDILGSMLIKLGVDPVYTMHPPKCCDFFNACSVAYTRTPEAMLLSDISAEMNAISEYEQMVQELTNPRVAAVIERIIIDEKIHLQKYKSLYSMLNM